MKLSCGREIRSLSFPVAVCYNLSRSPSFPKKHIDLIISIPNSQHPILHNSIRIHLLTNNKLISIRNDINNHPSVLQWMSLSHERYNSTIRNSLQILLVGESQGGRRACRSEIECNPFYQLQRSRSPGAARVIQAKFLCSANPPTGQSAPEYNPNP